jgi:hypothetical protein
VARRRRRPCHHDYASSRNGINDAIGRRQPAGSFTELFDVSSPATSPPEEERPLGGRISVNELGHIIAYPRTPDITQTFDLVRAQEPDAAAAAAAVGDSFPSRTTRSAQSRRSLFRTRPCSPIQPSRAATPSSAGADTFRPLLQPSDPDSRIGAAYAAIRRGRAELKRLNAAFGDAQAEALRAGRAGEDVKG